MNERVIGKKPAPLADRAAEAAAQDKERQAAAQRDKVNLSQHKSSLRFLFGASALALSAIGGWQAKACTSDVDTQSAERTTLTAEANHIFHTQGLRPTHYKTAAPLVDAKTGVRTPCIDFTTVSRDDAPTLSWSPGVYRACLEKATIHDIVISPVVNPPASPRR
jgi:hypothetical protein